MTRRLTSPSLPRISTDCIKVFTVLNFQSLGGSFLLFACSFLFFISIFGVAVRALVNILVNPSLISSRNLWVPSGQNFSHTKISFIYYFSEALIWARIALYTFTSNALF